MNKLHLTKNTFAKISKMENISLGKKAESLFAEFTKKNTPHSLRRKQIVETFAKF